MRQTNEPMNERVDKEILFSKTVKAGKRVYYIDVKRDRRGALYLSITESKRVKDGNDEERPVFEKHKIFLYREDLEKFMAGITAAVDYAIENSPVPEYPSYHNGEKEWGKPEDVFFAAERGMSENFDYGHGVSEEEDGSDGVSGGKIKIDLDF